MKITQKELKKLIKYDPETGFIKWIKPYGRANSTRNIKSAGFLLAHGYMGIGVKGKKYYQHRLIWFFMTGKWPKNEIDHINKDRSDNRWCNLREVTRRQNMFNINFKGYRFFKPRNKYSAQIYFNTKNIHLGYYKTAIGARVAYLFGCIDYYEINFCSIKFTKNNIFI